MALGVDYCGLAKTSQNVFFLATLEKLIKYWPGGSYLVMKSTPRFTVGRPLIEIEYKQNSRKVRGFIATEGVGIIEPGDPYLSHFHDIYSNVDICPSVCPHLIGRYFNACNLIYNHNMIRQYDLALDKYWVTHNGYFRLATNAVSESISQRIFFFPLFYFLVLEDKVFLPSFCFFLVYKYEVLFYSFFSFN